MAVEEGVQVLGQARDDGGADGDIGDEVTGFSMKWGKEEGEKKKKVGQVMSELGGVFLMKGSAILSVNRRRLDEFLSSLTRP